MIIMRYTCNTCHLQYDKITKCECCNDKTCRGCLYVLVTFGKTQYVCKGCYTDKMLKEEIIISGVV